MVIKLNKLIITKYTLLLYSILPAFAKISEMSLFYAFYIPLLGILYWTYHKQQLLLYKADIPFLLMFSITVIYIPISISILHTASFTSVFFSMIMFLLPMTGYFFSRLITINIFSKSVIFVGLIHAILGILMYGFIQFPTSIEGSIRLIKDGTMAFRMSSVSGSLGLGSLMLASLPFALTILLKKKNRVNIISTLLLFIALIFTMQRSAWLGASLYFLLVFIYININKNSVRSKKNIYLFVFVLFVIGISISHYIDLHTLKFIISRIGSLSGVGENPITERSSMWIAGIENFLQVPSGIGLGTSGQAARVSGFISNYHGVPDGDYFRILSELGIGALFFYSYLFASILIYFFKLQNMRIDRFSVYLVVVGLSINMIGSDTTEFYFVNFLYWSSLGYLFKKNIKKENNDFSYISKL